jgi:hypothetical protein
MQSIATNPDARSRLLGEAFVENIRRSFEFKQFCGMIRERDSIAVSVGRDVLMLSRAGLAPIDLTPLSEDEWRAKMRRSDLGLSSATFVP